MVTQPRWLRALACAAITALLASAAVAIPVAAQADTAPLDPTTTPTTVSSDSLPTVQVNGVVWSQVIVGNTVFVGGDFTQAQPAGAAAGVSTVSRTDMLAYNLTTGVLINGFAPSFNAQVRGVAASPDGSTIYAVGNFTQVNGVNRYRAVALNASTGAVISGFAPVLNSAAYAVATSGSTVFIGGTFTTASNATRTRAASYSASTGALNAWAPNIPDHMVRAMVVSPDGSKVVLGGSFSSLNGSTSPGMGLGAVDSTTGASVTWNVGQTVYDHGDNSSIYSLFSDGTNVYGTGYVYGGLSDGNLEGAFNATWADGTINWIEDCHGDSYSVAALNNAVYTVSHDHYCGNVPGGFAQTDPSPSIAKKQYALAFSKPVAGVLGHDPYGAPYADWGGTPAPKLLTWYPDLVAGTYTGQSQAAWNVTAGNGYLLLGGEFPTVNGKRQTGLARFATSNLAPNTDGPRLGTSNWTPSAVSLAAGTVRLTWPSNWDRDNANLTYTVIRNSGSTPVYTTTAESEGFWVRPTLGFTDTGLTPGSTVTYRVKATDPFGNTASSATVSTTVSSGSGSSAYSQSVINDGATDYWRFGEASGSTVYDYAGFSDLTAGTGVTLGAAGAITGDSNTAANFSGDGTGLAATSTAIPGPTTFSVETWFKTTSTSGGKIVGFGNANTGNSSSYDRHVFMDGSGSVYFGVYPGYTATVQSRAGYNDGQWHYVVASLSSAGMQLFLDGKRVGSNANVTTAQAYSGYWRVGGDSSWAGSNYFTGTIDDTAIYPTALSATTVKAHWVNSGHGTATVAPTDAYGAQVFADGPDSYWRLGDPVGSTSAADASGNGVTATVNSGVTFGAPSGVRGTSDTAATFDGNGGLVVSSQPVTDPEVYSLQLWFKTTTNRGGKLIGFGDQPTGTSNNYDRHVWMLDTGQLEYGTYTGQLNTVTSSATYNDGAWHQVVATQGASGLRLYVDGALVGTNPQTQAQAYTGYWRLGGDITWGGNSSNFWAGTLDDVAIYSSALTAGQISNDYQLGAATNAPPTASFTASSTGLTASFDGTASTDSDGTVASYAWDYGDGSTDTGAQPSHTYATGGTYTVGLTVTDDKGATNTVSKVITVTAPNVAPTASFTAGSNGLGVSFDGSASSDSDGTVASYSWNFGDGTAAGTGATTSHTYATAGTYSVTLTVTDNLGATGSTTKSVTVVVANVNPTASFTSSASNLVASFDGSSSADSDGTIAGYAWNFGDSSTGTGVSPAHTYASAGTYTVTLTVTDNQGGTGTVTQPITVSAANLSPTASFTSSAAGLAASFDGSGSNDPDGTVASYSWNFGDGTTAGTGVSPTHTYAAAGTYSVVLTVTDNRGATGTTTKSLTVAAANVNPTAAFTSTANNLVASFDASSSADPDGTIASYAWTYGDSLVGSGISPSHTYASAGTYTVTLTVTDNQGGTGTVTKSVTVSAANVSPTASFTSNATGLAASFDGTASSDSDGTVASYSWNYGDGTAPGTGTTPSHTYATAGTYSVTLTVTDNQGATGTITKSVTVTAPANVPPTASFTTSSTGLALSADASGSSDSDGTISSYAWNFGDGATATGVTASHSYAAGGMYTVTLTVTDNGGATGTTTKSVTVTNPTTSMLAKDSFNRTVANGLGTADTGGSWTLSGTASDFSVSPQSAAISTAVNTTRSAYLQSVSTSSADVTVTGSIPAVQTGGTSYFGVVGRRIGTDDYSARLRVYSSGAVAVQLMHGGSTVLQTATISGWTYTAGTPVKVRLQVFGTSPTTVQARAWRASDTEPTTWQASTTDSSSALQASGSVGIRDYLGSGVTSGATVFGFSNFSAQNVGAPNVLPTASFTSSTNNLAASFDGSGSSDSDGSVQAWAWDFGDGSTGTGSTTTHTYAAAGTYTVGLTVTDDKGGKGTTTKSVTVTAATATHLASDAFGRTVSGGFGTADTGGAWTTSGGTANFSVASGTGVMSTPANTTLSAYLNSVSTAGSDVSATVTIPQLPVGGTLYAGVVGRRIGSDDYSSYVTVSASGAVSLSVLHGVNGLKTATVSTFTATAGTVVHVRMTTTTSGGTTTLRARTWLDGAAQPSTWQVTTTDTTAALQAAGSVGVRTRVSSGVSNAPIAVKVDDFVVDPA